MPPAFHGNPYVPGGDGTHMHFIWERLFLLIPKNGKLIPRLGLSHKFSKDFKQLTVHLRKGVLWHDKTPFTSKDVKTSFLVRYALGWGDALEKIKTPDDYTIIFCWRKPFGEIEAKVIFNEKIMAPYHLFHKYTNRVEKVLEQAQKIPLRDTSRFYAKQREDVQMQKAEILKDIFKFRPQFPIGTGPFKFSFVTGSDLGMVKFQEGWEAKNITVDEVRIVKGVSNDIAWAYLIAGEIDAAHPATPQDVTEQILKLNPKTKLMLPSDYMEFGFVFNLKKAPMSDINFRKAIAYGIEKDRIRMISYYYGSTAGPYSAGILHSLWAKFLDKNFTKRMTAYKYNTKKTHEILKKAGYKKDKEGFYAMPNGKPIKIEIAAVAGYSDWVLGCESMSNQLRKLGIRTQIRTFEHSQYHQRLGDHNFDIAASMGTDYKSYAHPATSFDRYYGESAYLKVATGIPDKLKSYDGKEIHLEKFVEVLHHTKDKKKFRETLQHLAWVSNEYLPFLTIYEKNLMVFVVSRRVQGWPGKDDPIWSASGSGLEYVFAYLIATGKVQGVK